MTVIAILSEIQKFYQDCRTYSDTGRSTVTFSNPTTHYVNTIESSTRFHRDKSFTLKYSSTLGEQCVAIESDMKTVQVHNGRTTKVYDCLSDALRIKAGVSSRVSTLVPLLLIQPINNDSWLYKMTNVEERDEHIKISSDSGNDEVLIDSTTFRIQKIKFNRKKSSLPSILGNITRFAGEEEDMHVCSEYQFFPCDYIPVR